MNTALCIENRTDFDTGRICDLIDYATQGYDVHDVGFLVEHAKPLYHLSGYAQVGQTRYSPWKGDATNRFLIVIRLPPPTQGEYPCSNNIYNRNTGRVEPYGGKRSPYIVMNDWREAVIRTAAHEIWHVEQWRNKERKRESACERRALATLACFRAALEPRVLFTHYTKPLPVPETPITKGTSLWKR